MQFFFAINVNKLALNSIEIGSKKEEEGKQALFLVFISS